MPVYYQGSNAGAGVVAQAFDHARSRQTGAHQEAIERAHRTWHASVPAGATPVQVAQRAVVAAHQQGVYRPVVQGLVATGAVPSESYGDQLLQAAYDAGGSGVELLKYAGSGVAQLARDAGAGTTSLLRDAMPLAREVVLVGPGGRTIERVISHGQDKAAETIQHGVLKAAGAAEHIADDAAYTWLAFGAVAAAALLFMASDG